MRAKLFPLEEGFEGNRGSPLVKGVLRIGFEDIEFLLDEVVFGMKAERTNRGDARIGGKFEDFGFQALFVVESANRMAHEDVPGCDNEFSGHGHGGFVSTAAKSDGKAPLAKGGGPLGEDVGKPESAGREWDLDRDVWGIRLLPNSRFGRRWG